MIIVTGGAGFIGSALVKELNNKGFQDIAIVDKLGKGDKWKNLSDLKFNHFIQIDEFFEEIKNLKNIEVVFHLGACSSTTETDADYLIKNNYLFSKKIYDYCYENKIRLIYASSAAIYGDGSNGYSDKEIDDLKPLNMYGYSKKLFDQYVKRQEKIRPLIQCVGFRFFNVFGPNEYYKESMASVVFHSFNQIKKEGKVKLFKSYKKGYLDGEQLRDFIYIKDVISGMMFVFKNQEVNGIFNLGTGKARSFVDLVKPIFKALKLKENIEFIDMPQTLRGKYQYYTQADMEKFRAAGYEKKFYELEDAVTDYVDNYLMKDFKNY